MMRRIIALAAFLIFLASGVARGAGADSNVTLIKNATILTITHGNIEHGSILIRDGKIAEVGTDIKAPDGATVIDASGEFVLPGIIDCHSHIAVSESVNEGSVSVSSMVNIADVLNSEDPTIYYDLAGGVTVANVLHGSANPIGGQTIVIKLRWGKPSSELPVRGGVTGNQICSRRKSQVVELPAAARSSAALSRDAHGRGGNDSPGVHRGARVQKAVGRLQPPQSRRRAQSDSAATRSHARSARGSARRQAVRALVTATAPTKF